MRLLFRLLLSAIAFTSVLPMIHGISFHGSFATALLISFVFGLMLWAVETLTMGIAAVWTLGTLGLALLWLIPAWILGFWLLPAIAIILTADVMPQSLSVDGFFPAAIAGVVMLCIALATSKLLWQNGRKPAH